MNWNLSLRDAARWLLILLIAGAAVGLFGKLPAFASSSQQSTATPASTATLISTATPRPRSATTVAATPTRRATPIRRATPTRQATPARQATPTRQPTSTRRATPTPTPTATPAASATQTSAVEKLDGLTVYMTLGCGGCHRLAAANSVGGFGPTHEHIATTAAQRILASDYNGAATTAAEFIVESIQSPEAYVHEDFRLVKYRMPNYDYASDEQVAAIVEFLMLQE